jgi:hypothetical protein
MATATTCKHCHATFTPERNGAQYCSHNCRSAAYRKRHAPVSVTSWAAMNGQPEPRLATISRTRNADGTRALSKAELAPHLLEIAERDDGGEPKTGRRFYYLALSHGYIQPDMTATDNGKKSRDAAYDRITDVLGTLRKLGALSWDAVLDLTRELDEWQTYGSPREARAATRRRYTEDRWLGQDHYPILIVEKDTMEPVCKPMARAWQMPFASSRGYSSLKLQHDVADMLRQRYAKHGQWAMVYFISDHDPSGFDLQRAWEDALKDFDVYVWEFVRIGLTRDQVNALPDPILQRGIDVKLSDSRSEGYIRQHGDRCWETDILPAAVIEQALDAHIHGWLDVPQWDQRDAEIERARALL